MEIVNLNSNLSLVRAFLPQKKTAVQVEPPTDHHLVIDCSGSMSHELPKIRNQLKNRLPSLVKEGDTVTVIWFSGRNEFGVLIEGIEFATAKDLQNTNTAIDRWLKPIGLTGFKQPLEEAKKVIAKLKKVRPQNVPSLFFLTDGYDNQWSKKDILDVCSALGEDLSAATLVEYGYYCNRPLMNEMAENLGAALIFSDGFSQYEPVFEDAMRRRISGGKKVEVKLGHTPHRSLVYSKIGDQLCTFKVENNAVMLPENVSDYYYLTPDRVGETVSSDLTSGLYGGLSVFSQRMASDEVFALLKATGDVSLIKQFSNCFGKQAYSSFQQRAEKIALGDEKPLSEGYDPKLVPPEDAFTILDALAILTQDDDNKFHPGLMESYSRTTRATLNKADHLSKEQQDELTVLTNELPTASSKRRKEIMVLMENINSASGEALSFDVADEKAGYSVSNLVMNETRPNVSIQVRMAGTVDLNEAMKSAPDGVGKVPEEFPTFVYRNYTVIRDGIVNVKKLPVSLTKTTFDMLQEGGLLKGLSYKPGEVYNLELTTLPIVNRKMIKQSSARTLFEKSFELEKLKAKNKVYKEYIKQLGGSEKSQGFVDLYGSTTTAWLKEQGLTEYSGFSPKVIQAESTDFYMGKEIKVSLKGLSSLPSLNDVKKAVDAKKTLTISQRLIKTAIDEVESVKKVSNEKVFFGWLETQLIANQVQTKNLRRTITEQKFSIVVGQIWPIEFASLDDNTLNIKDDLDKDLICTVNLNEIEVKI